MRGKKLLTGEIKMAESFSSEDWNWVRDAKSYPDDIFRLSILYIIHPVGEALEHKDVEEPRDLAREYVIISVDKIYMFIIVDFKRYITLQSLIKSC